MLHFRRALGRSPFGAMSPRGQSAVVMMGRASGGAFRVAHAKGRRARRIVHSASVSLFLAAERRKSDPFLSQVVHAFSFFARDDSLSS